MLKRRRTLLAVTIGYFYLTSYIFVANLFHGSQRYITMRTDDGRRLGNFLFSYASLLGIAKRNNLTPTITESNPLRNLFNLGMTIEQRASWFNSRVIVYSDYSYAYDNRTDNLTENFCCSVFKSLFSVIQYEYALVGFFQVYKYFQNVENELRKKHFKFHENITLQVRHFFQDNTPKYLTDSGKEIIYIGVHIRRGDMAYHRKTVEHGFTVANSTFIFNAMEYYTNKFSTQDIIFIVCTDDKDWYYEHIAGEFNAFMVLSHSDDPNLDLAILSHCNHSIITVGSYGWWSAWLAGGITIYYADWPRPGSKLMVNFHKDEYFPPEWIPMS